MFWDRAAVIYDLFADVYNRKVNQELCRLACEQIQPDDNVLECACGTGMISVHIAPRCRHLTATDFSENMCRRARKKCSSFSNVEIRTADILSLDFPDESFDTVIAANVIHLLDEPLKALAELDRVCKPGGKLIIPTYVNKDKTKLIDQAIDQAGADFKHDFTYDTYRAFFSDAGYHNISTQLIDGRVPCAFAVITKENQH